jgi:diguanylate cyclase (GGDEF)-like protein
MGQAYIFSIDRGKFSLIRIAKEELYMHLTVEQVVSGVNSLPALPAVAIQVLTVTGDPSSTIKDLDEVICQDLSLAANVLHLANSAFYSFPRHINTISDAIGVLGFHTIRDLVFTVSAHKMLSERSIAGIDIWQHAMACATRSRAIARNFLFQDVNQAFIAGLLHDVGKVVLSDYLRGSYEEMLIRARVQMKLDSKIEEDALGFTHAAVGKLLAENWNLPSGLIEAIAYHHSPQEAAENLQLAVIVHLADAVLSLPRIEPEEDVRVLASEALARLGLSAKDMKAIMPDLAEVIVDSSSLARPDDPPSVETVEPYTLVQEPQKRKQLITLKSIGDEGTCIDPDSRTLQVDSLFQQDQQLQSIVITQQGKPLGLIMRSKLYAKLGTRFGFELYTERPAALVMDPDPLILDLNTPVEIASQLAMRREKEKLYDDMILVEDDLYYGVVSVKNLIGIITESQLELARAANPLTNLPGNLAIEGALTERIESGEMFAVIYCDLDNFKAYNDYYGFQHGDQVLLLVAAIAQKAVNRCGKGETFLGHIGGDDFVIVTRQDVAEQLCQAVIKMFDAEIPSLYRAEDRSRGYIVIPDRTGINQQFPIMSVSLVVVTNEKRDFKNQLEVGEVAAELKRYAKSMPGSNVIWDRRHNEAS